MRGMEGGKSLKNEEGGRKKRMDGRYSGGKG